LPVLSGYRLERGFLTQSVLVVDDEPMARMLLRLMLVRAGFEVIEAEDGASALSLVAARSPDVVILDVMMPGMDGFEVCETLRRTRSKRELPIVMLSAKTDHQSIRRGLDIGANSYLTKPISPEVLTNHVLEVLSSGAEHGSEYNTNSV